MQSFRPMQVPRSLRNWLLSAVVMGLTHPLCAAEPVTKHRLQLTWTAPTECPTSEQIQDDVRNLLAQNTETAGTPVVVDASLQSTIDGRYALRLLANGQTRRIAGASCAKLAEAAALLIALLLDPNLSPNHEQTEAPLAKSHRADADPAQQSKTEPNASDPTIVPRRLRAEPTRTVPGSRLATNIELAGRLELGNWPVLEPGIVAGIGLEADHWRILARAGVSRPFRMQVEPTASLKLLPWTVGLEPALRLVHGPWSLEPGVGAELGITHSRSAELEPKSHTALSLMLLALLRGTREFGRGVRGWVGVGAGVPIVRPRWVDHTNDFIHALGPSLRGEFGLQWRL